jgi:hypothetical protein
MKNIIILASITFFYIQSSAQTRLTPGEIKGKHDTFIVYELDSSLMMDTIKRIGVNSKSNKYSKGIPYPKIKHPLPINQNTDIHVDKNAVRQIINEVLNVKLGALKRNKENIDVAFDFYPNGAIADVGYTLRKNTVITLQDIEEVDQRLRSTIKATFTGRAYLQYEAIYYPILPSIVF